MVAVAHPVGDCASGVTLSELALESFFPADAATGETLRRLAAGPGAKV